MTKPTSEQAKKNGAKGAAFREAKKRAADTGTPVYLEEWDVTIDGDGNKWEGSNPDRVDAAVAAAPEAIKRPAEEVEAIQAQADEVVDNTGDYVVDLPTTVLGRANYYMNENGLSEDDALILAQTQLGGTPGPGVTMLTPGDAGALQGPEPTGPDPALVAAYQERMQDYVPPKLDGRVIVVTADGDEWAATAPMRFLDYLIMSARWEEIKRNRPVNPADKLQMMLREAKRDDQDASIILNPATATGPASAFNPDGGKWG